MRNGSTPEIKSLGKALEVVDLVANTPRGLTFTEVRQALGLAKSTAHRLLVALTQLGLLRRTGDRAIFTLGLHLLQLGAAAASQIDLRAELRPLLRALSERTEETSNLAIRVGNDAVVIDQCESPHAFRIFAQVGRSVPAATSSLGKVLFAYATKEPEAVDLADLELPPRTPKSVRSASKLANEFAQVRARGYAVDDEENRLGVVCVGAPVRDSTGHVVAALSVSGPSARIAKERLGEYVQVVCEAATVGSRLLGYDLASTDKVGGERIKR